MLEMYRRPGDKGWNRGGRKRLFAKELQWRRHQQERKQQRDAVRGAEAAAAPTSSSSSVNATFGAEEAAALSDARDDQLFGTEQAPATSTSDQLLALSH